jgi:hypothetical protein
MEPGVRRSPARRYRFERYHERVREDLKGRKGRVHREEAASIFIEHKNILATRDTTSAELGQRDECLVTHFRNEDGVELPGSEEATLRRLDRWPKGTLEGHWTAVGDVREVVYVGGTSDGAAKIEDSNGFRGYPKHILCLNNIFCVMVVG